METCLNDAFSFKEWREFGEEYIKGIVADANTIEKLKRLASYDGKEIEPLSIQFVNHAGLGAIIVFFRKNGVVDACFANELEI